jgi:hypothetical protein
MTCSYCGQSNVLRDHRGGCVACGAPIDPYRNWAEATNARWAAHAEASTCVASTYIYAHNGNIVIDGDSYPA